MNNLLRPLFASFGLQRLALIAAIAWAVSGAAFGITVQGFSAPLHERFDNDPTFIGNPYSLSGIARAYSSGGTPQGMFATMISDTHFISANHLHPTTGQVLKFFNSNDDTDTSSGNLWNGVVQGGSQIAGTDLWIGEVLDSSSNPAPSWVTRYPLLQRQDETYWPSYTDDTLFVVGQSSGGTVHTGLRAGRNEATYVGVMADISGLNARSLMWRYDTAFGTGLGVDEAQAVSGDSGGSSFAFTHAGLSLIGVHWAIANDGTYDYTVDSLVSEKVGAIQSALALAGESATVVTDLLGDLNGDYVVDLLDWGILGTNYGLSNKRYNDGDVNGDGSVNLLDLNILGGQFGESFFAPADFNQDTIVDTADLSIISANMNGSVTAFTNGDADGSGVVDIDDVVVWGANRNTIRIVNDDVLDDGYSAPPFPLAGDANNNGHVNVNDLAYMSIYYNQSVTPGTSGDVNSDGVVDLLDWSITSANLGLLFGDADGSGAIDIDDVDIMLSNWGASVVGGYADGDINGDGTVDDADLNALGHVWGWGYATLDPNNQVVNIPEPTALSLAAMLAGCGMTGRRK